MVRILFVGQTPETVDYSDPASPARLRCAQDPSRHRCRGRADCGAWLARRPLHDSARRHRHRHARKATRERQTYDCVVIGGGIRMPPKSLLLFETVVNAVHKAAPNAAIAFNTRPEDTADAAARQLTPG